MDEREIRHQGITGGAICLTECHFNEEAGKGGYEDTLCLECVGVVIPPMITNDY